MTILIVFFGPFQADAAIGECGSKSGDWAQQRLVGTAVDGTTFASFGVDVCFTIAATSTQAMGQNGIFFKKSNAARVDLQRNKYRIKSKTRH